MSDDGRAATNLHAWMCDCGRYGITDGQRASRLELEGHMAGTGHAEGEYYYGAPGRRVRVGVTAVPTGRAQTRFRHRLLAA